MISSAVQRFPVASGVRSRRRREQAARRRTMLSGVVRRPVIMVPAPTDDRAGALLLTGWRALGYLTLAALVHGVAIVLGLVLLPPAAKTPRLSTRPTMVVQVVERLPVARHEVRPKPAARVGEATPTPERARRSPRRRNKLRKPRETPSAEVVRPAVVGVRFESTVRGGAGPAFATGDTLVGVTARRAATPGPARESSRGNEAGAGGSPLRALRAGAVLVKPRRLTGQQPPYPALYRARGIEADVTVRVRLNARGRAVSVTIVAPAREPLFNEAAGVHAQAERYAPATLDGRPIPYSLTFAYRFRLSD